MGVTQKGVEKRGAAFHVNSSPVVVRGEYPGITLYEWAARAVHYLEWQPGNGTLYELIVVEMSEFGVAGLEGHGGAVCIVWRNAGAANAGRAVVLPRGQLNEWRYVREKLDCYAADAQAILDGVRRVLKGEGDSG